VLGIWLTVAVGLTVLVAALDVDVASELRVPGADSQKALDLLEDQFPEFAGISAQVVFHAPNGVSAQQETIDSALARITQLDDIGLVSAPFGPASPDGTTFVAAVDYSVSQADLDEGSRDKLVEASAEARGTDLQVEVGGALGFFDATETSTAEQIGIVVALVILLVAFGSLVAAGLPLVAALVGLAVGLGLVNLLSLVADIPRTALTLVTMIGIGVGIDYALFMVTRYRELLDRYRLDLNSVGKAAATSGKAVVFAGGTVVISILGLAISGVPFVAWMGVTAAIVVAVMVAVAITLIPALLGFVGDHIDSLAIPGIDPTSQPNEDSRWVRWGRHVSSRPWPHLVIGVRSLVMLSLPLVDMRLGQSDAGNFSEDTSHRRAYDLISTHYGPGFNGPLLIAVDLTNGGTIDAVGAEADAIAGRDDVTTVGFVAGATSGDAAIFTVVPTFSPQAVGTENLVKALRNDVFPNGLAQTGALAHVASTTANNIDLAERIGSRLPWFVGAIVAASFVFLVLIFGSLLVPLKAALLNLLSIGAAYGVIVAIFQWGWGLSIVGLEDTIPISPVIPMLMFAVLFGLSMDYEVFLLSRIKEEYDRTGDNTESVVRGLASTGRIITSAALIMVCVFFGFVLSADPLIKMAGVGLGTAILVDATIVRCILVPSTMALLGDRNWWMPEWLARFLPRIDV